MTSFVNSGRHSDDNNIIDQYKSKPVSDSLGFKSRFSKTVLNTFHKSEIHHTVDHADLHFNVV